MSGWIKLYRDIQYHWIWKSDNRLKWWLDILLTVNHNDSKVLIGGKLVECKRGQSVMSLETWGKRWGVTKKAVKDFFILLQNDSMLQLENIKITTRITVCNYDIYQSEVNGQETDRKRTGNGQETDSAPKQEGIKNDKKEKNEKNIETRETIFISEVWQFNEQYPENMLKKFISYWTEKTKSKMKMRFETEKTFEINRRLATWASRDNEFNKIKSNDPDEYQREVKRLMERDANQK